jgi:hypothetical protein
MEIKERTRVNVRGTLNTLEINEVLELPRKDYNPASVRSTVGVIREVTCKAFSVSVKPDSIFVTRLL